MTAAALIARAAAVGVRLRLDGGRVRWSADAPPPADLLDDLRRHKRAIVEALAADAERLAALAETGAAALAAPDPDLAHERVVMAAARAAEAAGDVPALLPEDDHRRHLAGLMDGAMQRPPSWADASAPPSRGAWCGCCSRHRPEAGGRWWTAAQPRKDGLGIGPGWCCATCHPPPPGCDVREVRT